MKKLILIALLGIAVGHGSFGQSKETPSTATAVAAQWSVEHYYKVYQVARSLEDYDAATKALLDIIVEIPKNDTIVYELATLYYQMKKYPSAALCATEVLKAMPNNMVMREVAAVSFENIGVLEEAVKHYEKIYLTTDDFGVLYKVALFQFDLKRYGEVVTNLDILINRKEATENKIAAITTTGSQKEFPLKVVLLNLKGMAKKEQGDTVAAKALYNEALKIAPDFASAKENLTALGGK